MSFDNLIVEVRDDRVVLGIAGGTTEWLSWQEWREFSDRLGQAIEWIDENRPADSDGPSFEVESDD
jgi:hypothetical protein